MLEELLTLGVSATGTFQTNRRGIPDDVISLKSALKKKTVSQETDYYIREGNANIVYCLWKDTRVVSVMSTAHPGHQSDKQVTRNALSDTGERQKIEVPQPIPIEHYNQSMGGVDKSAQFLSYHSVLRKTIRYWKTFYYHLIDVAVVNLFVLYNHLALLSDCWTVSENDFRDDLVLHIMEKYGTYQAEDAKPGRPSRSDCRVRHGSTLCSSKARCQYCKLTGNQPRLTQHRCLECLGQPACAKRAAQTATRCGTYQVLTECETYGLPTTRQSRRSKSNRNFLQIPVQVLDVLKGQ